MSLELPGPGAYCSSQLIPYLGNKRALLPRLMPVFERLSAGIASPRFLDAFAGSGAVSRLARAMGMRVCANDWEPYAEAINSCWLSLRPADIDRAFGSAAGLACALADWNSMHPSAEQRIVPDSAAGEPYMAQWYAPSLTACPRLGEERLFYTAENAAFMDRARYRLEAEFPDPEPGSIDDIKRRLLLAGMLLEASVHANTSGVFKAYHRGFGGNGKDALPRILGRMELEAPLLPDTAPAAVFRDDARAFLGKCSGDIAYFDPPYNQHQYGSNYHILNTLLRWDGKPIPMENAAGHGVSKVAGIPEGWKATRSAFCSKRDAAPAIAELLDACDAAKLVFSWNADGNLSGEAMAELLSARGKLDIVALDYVSYRGGRQSASRSSRSREYLFVVDTRAPAGDASAATRYLSELAARDEALRSTYDPERVARLFGFGPLADAGRARDFPEAPLFFRPDCRRANAEANGLLSSIPAKRRTAFMGRLAECACDDVVAELSALLAIVERAVDSGDGGSLISARKSSREAPRLIRKLAHGKYAMDFDRYIRAFRAFSAASGEARLAKELDKLEALMGMRFGEYARAKK